MLRYTADTSTVLDRLNSHPRLLPCKASGKIKISCKDKPTQSFLKQLSSYTPLISQISNPLSLTAHAGTHPDHENWLGLQDKEQIDLYFPAYQNASTLAFAFFHEFAHWLQKEAQVLSDSDWDSYIDIRFPDYELSRENDLVALYETFANDFAWYCTNPSYLELQYPQVCEWFAARLKANGC